MRYFEDNEGHINPMIINQLMIEAVVGSGVFRHTAIFSLLNDDKTKKLVPMVHKAYDNSFIGLVMLEVDYDEISVAWHIFVA